MNLWKPYIWAWFYLKACWTDGSICMVKHWSKLIHAEYWENQFLTSWPWPMTLIFRVDPDIIQVDPGPKFNDITTIGLAPRPLEVKCVGALKERKKERNKETRWKLKGRALHWPNESQNDGLLVLQKVLILSFDCETYTPTWIYHTHNWIRLWLYTIKVLV